jgi:leader peptidase (prepilin peptidase)/N-methyltransferase
VNLDVAPYWYGVTAIAGLGVGVLVNLAADRVVGDEEPPWRAGACRKCGASLPAARVAPLLNFAASRRTCATCGTRASLRRPLIEVTLAALFPLLLAHLASPDGGIVYLAPLGIFAVEAAATAVLAFIFVVDLEHHLILDISVYPTVASLLLVALLFDHKAFAGMLFGVVICGGLFLLLYIAGYVIYRTEALGLGDVKLAVLIGLLIGWPGVTTALVIAALVGAAISVLLLGLGSATGRTFIPYGTALVAGAVAALLFAPPLW